MSPSTQPIEGKGDIVIPQVVQVIVFLLIKLLGSVIP